MGRTKIPLGILLGLSLLALVGAKSLRPRRSVKGGARPIQKYPVALASYPEIAEYPSKDVANDPDWEPNYEDYEDDEDYSDDNYDDIVYDSDHNPIIVSIGNSVDNGDKIPYDVVDEDYDDKTKDPDFEPDYDEETPEDHEYDPEDDVDYDEELVDESYSDDAYDDEDDLWVSEDDPDYVPSEEVSDEDGDGGKESLEDFRMILATQQALDQCQSAHGYNFLEESYERFGAIHNWEIDLIEAAVKLLRDSLHKKYIHKFISEGTDATASVKGKRQYSQHQQSGQIQQSSQVQYDVHGSDQQQSLNPIIVTIDGGDYDDKTKDPDYIPDYDAETPEDHEYDPEDDVDYEEEHVYASYSDDWYDDDDDLWSSDADPDYVPKEEDTEGGNDVDTESTEDLRMILATLQALEQCQADTGNNYIQVSLKNFDEVHKWDLNMIQAAKAILKQSLYKYQDQEKSASVKGKRQFKSAGQYSQQQQSGQIQQSGQVQYNVPGSEQYQGEVGQIHQINEVSEGVEPLHPDAVYEVSSGVEAIDGEASEDGGSSFFNWLGEGWGHVVNAADTVGDHVGDTFDTIGDKVSGAVDTLQDTAGDAIDSIQDVAGTAVDKIQGAAHSAKESVVDAYHSMKDKLPKLREKIRHFFSKFGLMVQRGADYCVLHISQAADQVREAQILDKLKQKLNEGNEQVATFFTILGQKATSWYESHGHVDVDTGLIVVEGYNPQEGSPIGENIADLPDRETVIPNLFQDQEVVDQLRQMVSSGVITQEDIDVFAQEQMQSGQQVDPPQDPYQLDGSSAIQVQHHRRRHLRSKIKVAKGHHYEVPRH